ncbi:MAG: plastocyanin/azurin family copper-binding protein [Ginsengibacter sp.]
MKNQITVLGIIILFPVLFMLSCSSPDQKSTDNKTATEVNIHKTDTVIIQQMKFNPEELKVSVGDTVVWLNKGMVAHNVTSYKSGAFYSDTLNVGKTWKMAVTDSASYFCSIHPSMQGKLLLK